MGTERKNIVPGNLCIIWKLNEAWPLKKDSVIFLRFLNLLKHKKNFILEKDTITVLEFLIPKKVKFFSIEKGLHHFLETHKNFNFEKWLCHILMTLKVFQSSFSVEWWWTAASEGRLLYHIYDERTWPALSAQFHSIRNIFPFWDQIFVERGDWYLF